MSPPTVPVGSHIDDGEHHVKPAGPVFYSFLVITFCLANSCIAKPEGVMTKILNYRRTQGQLIRHINRYR